MEKNKIEKYKIKIAEKINETSDSVSLRFDIPENDKPHFSYHSGQFVTCFIDINGEIIPRSYSFSSSPISDDFHQITVKRVPGGMGSAFLIEAIEQGDELDISAPMGRFFNPFEGFNKPLHYILFAAGSGITPIFSIIKTVLQSNDEHKVTLLYSNKQSSSIIFQDELNLLANANPDRLNVIHFLSQNTKPTPNCKNKMQKDDISQVVSQILKKDKNLSFYLCGPDAYMAMIEGSLSDLKIDKSCIHKESFGTSTETEYGQTINQEAADPEPHGKVLLEMPDSMAETVKIIANIDGQDVEVETNSKDSILDSLLNAGHNPPFSCMAGACMACSAKITEGVVYQEDQGVLSMDNINSGDTLTCQSHPVSKIVKVKY